MTTLQPRLLVVEDEFIVAGFICEAFADSHWDLTVAEDAESGWDLLQSAPAFDAVLLDRGLPGMSGMDLLRRIKADPALAQLPVIMETGQGDSASVREGFAAGAYFYLTKPLRSELLVPIVQAAVEQQRARRDLQSAQREADRSWACLWQGEFRCRTLAEARELAQSLARGCPDPERALYGLQELLVNAVEHGNLAISYAQKSALLLEESWQAEVDRRLADPRLGARTVTVHWQRHEERLEITIRDQGEGFDWKQYLELSAERAFDLHGRGIAMSRRISFEDLEYQGNGNTVIVRMPYG